MQIEPSILPQAFSSGVDALLRSTSNRAARQNARTFWMDIGFGMVAQCIGGPPVNGRKSCMTLCTKTPGIIVV